MTNTFMNSPHLLFSSESVTEGHPDKVCDQISDAVLDACLKQDPYSRVACETAAKTGFVVLLGEITTHAQINFDEVVRKVILEIGYNDSEVGFDGNSCGVLLAIAKQSGDIAMGVNKALEAKNGEMTDDEVEAIGAGDQGMMFGFACNETPVLMPMPIYLAHALSRRLSVVRKNGTLPWLRPDGKTQVTVEYSYGRPRRVDTVLVSTQHSPELSQDVIKQAIIEHVILPTLPSEMVDDQAPVMGIAGGVADIDDISDGFVERHAPVALVQAPQALLQRLASHKLLHHVVHVAIMIEVEDLDDVGMAQLGDGCGFFLEAHHELGVIRQVSVDHFDCHHAP